MTSRPLGFRRKADRKLGLIGRRVTKPTAAESASCSRAHISGKAPRLKDNRRPQKASYNVLITVATLALLMQTVLAQNGRSSLRRFMFPAESVPVVAMFGADNVRLSLTGNSSPVRHTDK